MEHFPSTDGFGEGALGSAWLGSDWNHFKQLNHNRQTNLGKKTYRNSERFDTISLLSGCENNKATSLFPFKTTSWNSSAVGFLARNFLELQHALYENGGSASFDLVKTTAKTSPFTCFHRNSSLPSLIPPVFQCLVKLAPTVAYSPAYSAPIVHLLLARRYSAPVQTERVGKKSLVPLWGKESIVNSLIYWKETICSIFRGMEASN